MRCLLLHCKEFSYKLDHPTSVAENLDTQKIPKSFQNAMVIFFVIEGHDNDACINEAAKEIRKLTRKAQVRQIILNPFAHLSQSLAPADQAVKITQALITRLRDTWDGEVAYTSFGWYKSFLLDVYGHDASQVFREF